ARDGTREGHNFWRVATTRFFPLPKAVPIHERILEASPIDEVCTRSSGTCPKSHAYANAAHDCAYHSKCPVGDSRLVRTGSSEGSLVAPPALLLRRLSHQLNGVL